MSTPDPYAGIEGYTLSNGMRVILAPSEEAKTVQIRVRVKAGDFSDPEGQSGIAHLLEHALFTNAKTSSGMSYLEIIKEKGGSANATTSETQTQYFATISSGLKSWIIELFGKMLMERNFDPALLEQTKGPVALEIGQTTALDYVTDLRAEIDHAFNLFPGFWKTEFEISDPPSTNASARIDLAKITSAELGNFYRRFYHPDNLILFLSGNFKKAETVAEIQKAFGQSPFRAGDTWREPQAHPYWRAYRRSTSTFGTASIEIGAKVDFQSISDEIITRVYLNHLAHRLMKEIRNIKGDTYTVRPVGRLRRTYGKLAVSFEAPTRSYAQYETRVRELIEKEARQGEISEALFNEAKDLFRENYVLKDRDSYTLMHSAERWYDNQDRYQERDSSRLTDFQAYERMDFVKYRDALKRVLAHGHEYENLVQPPVLFRYEELFLVVLGFAFWMVVSRRSFGKVFPHLGVRWVRKLSHPPAYLLPIFAITMGGVFSVFAIASLDQLWLKSGLIGLHFVVSDYLYSFICLGAALFACQIAMGLFAKKIMVVHDELWIKSMSYRSRRIPLEEIQKMELMRAVALPFSLKRIVKVAHRNYFYDPCLWRRGLYIELKNGQAFFIGVKNPDHAWTEFNAIHSKYLARQAGNPATHEQEFLRAA